MSTLPVSALLDLSGLGASVTGQADPLQGEDFQALLGSASGTSGDASANASALATPAFFISQPAFQQPQAAPPAPIALPPSVFAHSQSPQPQTPTQAPPRLSDNSSNNKPDQTQTATPQQPKEATLTASSQKTRDSTKDSAPSATASQSDTSAAPTGTPVSKPRPKIQDQLDALMQAIQSVLQPAAPVATAVAATGTTTPTASATPDATASATPAASPAAAPLPALPALPSDTAPGAADQAATPTPLTVAENSILTDMQSITQQFQQLAPDVTQTTPSAADMAKLQSLTDNLAADVSKLTQLLQPMQQAATATPAPASLPATALPAAPQPAAATIALPDLIKTGLTQLRDQLQQLKPTTTPVAQAQAQPSTDSKALSLAVSVPLPADPLAKQATQIAAGASVTQLPTQAAQQATAQPTPVTPISINGQAIAAITPQAVGQVSSGGGHDASGNDDRSNQSSAQPLSAAAAGSARAAGSDAPETDFSAMLSQTGKGPVLDQVTLHMKTALADGSSDIHIRLDPADLGKLDIKLAVGADGKTGVTITADNKNTLDLLQRDTQGLTQALRDAGLSTDSNSLNFSLNSGRQDSRQGQNPSGAQTALTYRNAQPDDEDGTALAGVSVNNNILSRSYVLNLNQGLDIKI